MHQVCLGVVKRLILLFSKNARIAAVHVSKISERLEDLTVFIPQEFAHKPRGLSYIDYWKARELRQFLLYTAQFALKGVLSDHLYKHFMSLSVALGILVSPQLAQIHKAYAHRLLVFFIHKSKEYYGEGFIVYSVHSLAHLAEVEVHGCLDSCSAWMFESYLGHMKKYVRSGRNPTAQLVKRLREQTLASLPQSVSIKITPSRPNNAYILRNASCCETLNV